MATEFFQGLDKVLKNLDAAEGAIVNAAARGMGKAALLTEAHIKVEYNRERTGKGFTDRTSLLRQSISHKVTIERGMIVAWIFASGGGPGEDAYAHHVEHIVGGKYAFMLPGFLDMKREIVSLILIEMKKRGLILK